MYFLFFIINFKFFNISTHFRDDQTNVIISLSKYPINYLEITSVLTNFEITVLSTLTSHISIGFIFIKN